MTKLDTTADANLKPVDTPVATPPSSGPFINRLTLWVGGVFLVIALLALGAWWLAPHEFHGVLLQSPQVAEDFTLQASTGEPLAFSDLRGKFVVLYFGYTFCPDVCPTTLNDLKRVAEILGPDKMQKVQVVFVTVDPERDTAEQLASYLKYFDPSFIGLTGTTDEIKTVASQFGIYFERHEGSAATGYLMDHTSAITIVDAKGYVRLVFPHGTVPADMAADLAYLLRRG